MRFATFKDLRLNTASVIRDAGSAESVIITKRGKPVAVLIPADEDSVEEVLKAAAAVRLRRTFEAAQRDAKRAGADKMTMAQINALVNKVRAERRRG